MGLINRIVLYIWNKVYNYSAKVKNNNIKRLLAECGNGLKIYGSPIITSPERIKIGENVALNNGCVLNAAYSNIEIGNNVVVSANAIILGATLDPLSFINNKREHINNPVHIGDNTWICAGAIICPGVNIVGGVIIAAGAVVTKDIKESNVLIGGNPAHIIKHFPPTK